VQRRDRDGGIYCSEARRKGGGVREKEEGQGECEKNKKKHTDATHIRRKWAYFIRGPASGRCKETQPKKTLKKENETQKTKEWF
jgi:hypothetical protein